MATYEWALGVASDTPCGGDRFGSRKLLRLGVGCRGPASLFAIRRELPALWGHGQRGTTWAVPVYPEYVTTMQYVCEVCIVPSPRCSSEWDFHAITFDAMQETTFGTAVPFCSGVSVTSAEMFCWPEDVTPVIVKSAASVPLAVIPAVAGVIVMEETVSATVAVVVPVMVPEEAVMVAVPAETPASMPPVVMVATVVSELDQHTVLPVQFVPPFRVLRTAVVVSGRGGQLQ